MSGPRLGKSLSRLLNLRMDQAQKVSEYAAELRRIGKKAAEDDSTEKKSRFFRALADETRLRVLRMLEVREMCVCEVMFALGLTQPTASHHLGILESAGLVKDRKDGKWVFYSLADPELVKNMHKLNIL